MQCIYCGTTLPEPGRSNRRFCTQAHRQAYYRNKQASTTEEVAARIAELDQTVAELQDYNARLKSLLTIEQQRVANLEREVTRLSSALDVESRVRDNKPRNFRGWLRKQSQTELIARLLARDTFPLKGSRAIYEAQVRTLRGPETDLLEFADLWRGMILSEV